MFNGGDAEERFTFMFDWVALAMLSGLVALVVYELVQEVRGSSGALHDHYHE